MTSEDINYPNNFFYANEIISLISGLRLPDKHDNLFKKCFYYIYIIFLYGTSITFFVFEIFKLEDTVKDPTKFFSHIGLLFTHVVGILKACLLLSKRGRILKVMDLLQDKRFRYETSGNFQPGLMLHEAKRKSLNVSILVSSWYF